MPKVPALNPNFEAVGFNDTYFINNMGSILLSIVGFLVLQSFAFIAKKLKKKSDYFKSKWIDYHYTCFWHMPIRVILSSYSILSLSAFMNLQNLQWKYAGPIIDTLLSLCGLAITLSFPVFVIIFMLQKFNELDDKKLKAAYGSLYEGLDKTNKWIIGFRVWFIVRRLLISIIVIYSKNLIIQIMLWYTQELLSIFILGYGQPYEKRKE